MEGCQILNLGYDVTVLEQFVMRWLILVEFNICSKQEVPIFNHSEDIEVVPKF